MQVHGMRVKAGQQVKVIFGYHANLLGLGQHFTNQIFAAIQYDVGRLGSIYLT